MDYILRLRFTTLENDIIYIQDDFDNMDEILTTTLRSAQDDNADEILTTPLHYAQDDIIYIRDDIIYIQDDIISQDYVFL